jgi:hypothetical protein
MPQTSRDLSPDMFDIDPAGNLILKKGVIDAETMEKLRQAKQRPKAELVEPEVKFRVTVAL